MQSCNEIICIDQRMDKKSKMRGHLLYINQWYAGHLGFNDVLEFHVWA